MFGFNKKNTDQNNLEIKTFKIEGMHCSSCALSIDGDLEDLEGVKESSTNYARAETKVKFNPLEVNEKKLVEQIAKTGYKATPLS